MRRITALMLILLTSLFVVACGGSSHKQKVYHTKYGVSAHSPTFGLPPKGVTLPRYSTARTVQMLDTVNTGLFSGLNIRAVAGYTSGHWPTYWQLAGKYPRVVAIMVYQTHFGVKGATRSCLDVEPGDAPASAAGPWDKQELARGFTPCNYSSLSEMPAVKSSITRAGVSLSRVLLWDANWTFVYHLDQGYSCTQWTDHYLNRSVDSSACTLTFAKLTTPPKPIKLICFGKSARLRNTTCKKVIAQVNGWTKAASSSRKVYVSRGCPVLAQRATWFSHAIAAHPKSPRTASRRRALAASRRAYRRNSCGKFAQRFNYFTKKAAAERTAYS